MDNNDESSGNQSTDNAATQQDRIPKNATEKQISSAYKKLALKYHPDRNQDNEEAAAMFKSVSEAYHVLIDPNKRRQYDLGGEKAAPTEFESVDVTSLGGIGRVFGAMISRLGVPIATQIAPEVIETAHNICSGLEGGGPPLDPRVSDLAWGWGVDGKVDRQAAVYYRISVDSRHVENGFVVVCRGQAKGKFKLILFDAEGAVLYQEESGKPREKTSVTQAALYFTNFDTFRLGEPSLASLTDKETPPLFHKLESFSNCKHQVVPGQYLLCVYGDNFIGKTHYNIVAVQSKNDAPEVVQLEETDESLVEAKASLETLKAEHAQAKAAYESVVARMKTESERVDTLLATREKAYSGFFESSIRAFSPSAASDPANDIMRDVSAESASAKPVDAKKEGDASAEGGAEPHSLGSVAFSAAASAANTATSVGINATQQAAAAGGWLARRLSMGLQSIVKPANKAEGAAAESDSSSVQPATSEQPAASAPAEFNTFPVGAEESVAASATTSDAPSTVTPLEIPADVPDVSEGIGSADGSDADAPSTQDDESASAAPTTPTITRPVIKSKKDKKADA